MKKAPAAALLILALHSAAALPPNGDADRDGLPNLAEAAAAALVPALSPTNAHSAAAAVPDYFHRVGSLYLGQMYTDHDFMDDLWERRAARPSPSPALYDPWEDPDDDGWCNFAECRAGTDPARAESRPAPAVRATVAAEPGGAPLRGSVVVQAFGRASQAPDATWAASVTTRVMRATLELGAAADGGPRGGRNTFVAFLDEDGSGAWDPGEPYGVATDVDVGWSEAAFTVELARTTPVMARYDLAADIGTPGTADNTDRGCSAGKGFAPNETVDLGDVGLPSAASLVRARVVRNWCNNAYSSVKHDTVFVGEFDLSVHPSLTEADILAKGMLDLDWGTVNKAFGGSTNPQQNLTNATYRVVIGDDVGTGSLYGRSLPVFFCNMFEKGTKQTPTVPDPELAQIVYAGRPTFRWSHTNSIDKAYPAFQLRIFEDAAKKTVVYDSGPRRAPARDSNGVYEWTAPVCAGMATPSNKVLAAMSNYYWAVSMLDAKFTAFGATEAATPFRLGASGDLSDGREHGSVAVRVKYHGALAGSLSASPATPKNLVRVQAFTSPDFSGTPAAEAYVTDVSTIASEDVLATNAVLVGVPPGLYYVRAYVDTDADGAKSGWESWGYACAVGAAKPAPDWTPLPVAVSYDSPAPAATVFIEDADTDNDGFPDAWEWSQNGSLAAQGPVAGATARPTVNPNLAPSLD